MIIRNVKPSDYQTVISVLDDWWGGRKMASMLPRLFFIHFQETSFVAEENGRIVGLLIGFLSQTYSNESYIHFAGVHPSYRKQGIGKTLYELFFNVVRSHDRIIVHCVTSPINTNSIAFHTRMGFQIEPPATSQGECIYHTDYDGINEHRVSFKKCIHPK